MLAGCRWLHAVWPCTRVCGCHAALGSGRGASHAVRTAPTHHTSHTTHRTPQAWGSGLADPWRALRGGVRRGVAVADGAAAPSLPRPSKIDAPRCSGLGGRRLVSGTGSGRGPQARAAWAAGHVDGAGLVCGQCRSILHGPPGAPPRRPHGCWHAPWRRAGVCRPPAVEAGSLRSATVLRRYGNGRVAAQATRAALVAWCSTLAVPSLKARVLI